ncbi:MAG: MarR family transcriptional regulator [Clostridia bacterium]|nr:MarR family transcriptional regulator [Clostridia bacterium]
MQNQNKTADLLLDAWLRLSSSLWNTRIVNTMTFNEAHVLGILLRHQEQEPLTATDLIRRTRLLKSQMNKLLTTLEDKGFIERERSEQDKRMFRIILTDEGRSAYLAEHAGVTAIMEKLITKLGEEKAFSLTRDLNEVCGALDDVLSDNCPN